MCVFCSITFNFALKFNFLKLHKVDVKLVQSWYKLGVEKLQKMVQKHRKTYQLVGKNLEKTCKKLGTAKGLRVNLE